MAAPRPNKTKYIQGGKATIFFAGPAFFGKLRI